MACETQNANRTVIDREIGLQGSLDEDQHARLLAISESGIPDVLGDSGAPNHSSDRRWLRATSQSGTA